MKRAVLVNGVPASGKSTVARAVSGRFGLPLLSLDTIKEPFFDEIGAVDRAFNRKLGRASYAAIFNTIGVFPDPFTVVVEAWFGFQPPEVLTAHLAHAGIGATVELWCHAPPETIGDRYAARVPHRPSSHPGLEYVPELIALAASARPVGAGPCLAIDTTKAIDLCRIDQFLETAGFPTHPR